MKLSYPKVCDSYNSCRRSHYINYRGGKRASEITYSAGEIRNGEIEVEGDSNTWIVEDIVGLYKEFYLVLTERAGV